MIYGDTDQRQVLPNQKTDNYPTHLQASDRLVIKAIREHGALLAAIRLRTTYRLRFFAGALRSRALLAGQVLPGLEDGAGVFQLGAGAQFELGYYAAFGTVEVVDYTLDCCAGSRGR